MPRLRDTEPKNIRLAGPEWEPPGYATAPLDERRWYWQVFGPIAKEVKQQEIKDGKGVNGRKFKPVLPRSRPDGAKGAPLDPHDEESRTYRLLAVHVMVDGVTLYWKAWGRKSWSTILGYHAYSKDTRRLPIRNTIGISRGGRTKIKARAFAAWAERQKAQQPKPEKKAPTPRPTPVPKPASPMPAPVAQVPAKRPPTVPPRPTPRPMARRPDTAFVPRDLAARFEAAEARRASRLGGGPAPPPATPPPRPPPKPKPKPAPKPKPVPKPVAPAVVTFGPSTAQVKVDPGALRVLKTITNRDFTAQDVASLVGATHDAKVTAYASGDRVHVSIQSPRYHSSRTIKLEAGLPIIHNDLLVVEKAHRGAGLGAQILGRQVEHASKWGFDRLETDAARSSGPDGYVGYYAWPRLGYDGFIAPEVRRKLPEGMKDAVKVRDLMTSQERRDWWKEHGVWTNGMIFRLQPGSESMEALQATLREGQAKKKK